LSGKTFESEDGQAYGLSDIAGKPLLVHFRGSWYPPCLEELPFINRRQGLLWNEGLLVVPLSRDSGGPAKVREIYNQLEIGFLPVFTDRLGSLAHEARIAKVPVTLFVNRDNREIGRLYGSVDWESPEMLEHFLACLLAGPVQTAWEHPGSGVSDHPAAGALPEQVGDHHDHHRRDLHRHGGLHQRERVKRIEFPAGCHGSATGHQHDEGRDGHEYHQYADCIHLAASVDSHDFQSKP
jgi:hypothetical protein